MTLTLKSLALAAGLALSLPSLAHTEVFAAPLLGSSEVPAATTTGSGFAKVTVDLDLLTMRVEASFSGLLGNVTNSHIHCCVAPGANIRVATQLPTFVGFPSGGTSGTYDHTFDMSLLSSYNTTAASGFVANNGGTVGSAFNALVLGLESGQAYLNVHTTLFPGGEIRGLLVPVPEPETYALMLAGLAGVLTMVRRKKQQG